MPKSIALFFFATFAAFASDAQAVTIDWTPVGKPGNAPDPATGSLYGAVDHPYSIDKYDVTYNQYVEFLNAKDPTGANTLHLYSGNGVGMGDPVFGGITYNAGNADGSKYTVMSGDGNHPVTATTFYDTIRFANWLNNGQGNGDTETGAYTLGPLGVDGNPLNGSIMRNAGARIFIPTENEWYKAAFYNPGANSYFLYPTSSDTAPTAIAPPGVPNSANYNNAVGNVTDVGAYVLSPSPYGTFDQAGNIFQWTETQTVTGERIIRGSTYDEDASQLTSANRSSFPEEGERTNGFRVAMVPEPSSLILAAVGFAALIACGRRRPTR